MAITPYKSDGIIRPRLHSCRVLSLRFDASLNPEDVLLETFGLYGSSIDFEIFERLNLSKVESADA